MTTAALSRPMGRRPGGGRRAQQQCSASFGPHREGGAAVTQDSSEQTFSRVGLCWRDTEATGIKVTHTYHVRRNWGVSDPLSGPDTLDTLSTKDLQVTDKISLNRIEECGPTEHPSRGQICGQIHFPPKDPPLAASAELIVDHERRQFKSID